MYSGDIFKKKHELWLKILFSSFAIKDEKIKTVLYDFAQIEFRHLKWIGKELRNKGIDFNLAKDEIDIKHSTNFDYFYFLINELESIKSLYKESVLFNRIKTDEDYFIQKIKIFLTNKNNNANISSFDKKRVYEGKQLDSNQTNALTLFLFEESYKEYELILIYFYMQIYTDNLILFDVYQDLIDESQYHLKCFGNMLAKMGILTIPRMIVESIYKINDIEKFFINGIKEEENAKEQCRALAEAVQDDELSGFFDYINFQENYHIELMKKVIKVVKNPFNKLEL